MNEVNGYTYVAIDGVENCIQVLKDIEKGKIHNCFIEMSACVGSCIGGPVMDKLHRTSPINDFIKIEKYAGSEDFDVLQPNKNDIRKRARINICDTNEESQIREYANIKEIKEMNNMLFYKNLIKNEHSGNNITERSNYYGNTKYEESYKKYLNIQILYICDRITMKMTFLERVLRRH